MSILALPIGLLLPTVSGWLLIRIVEWNTPVLFRIERWIAGAILGLLLTMYVTFLLSLTGIVPLTLLGFLSVQILLTAALGGLFYWKRSHLHGEVHAPVDSPATPSWFKILAAVVGVWIIIKLITGSIFLVASPVYFDDTYKNWNLRGKIFYVTQELTLEIPQPNGTIQTTGINSYPPAVPMAKTWLATIAGEWNEPLINSIHLLWFWGVLALVYFALRRLVSRQWSLTGVYLLASLPLFVIHGNTAYADVFVAAHLFLAISFLFFGLREEGMHRRLSFLKLAALSTALLMFTKNESLLLHLPPILLLLSIGLLFTRTHTGEMKKTALWFGSAVALVLIPWVLYKWTHGLEFGNAKGITGLELGWQKGVLTAIWVNTFFEGNWNLLFPLFLGLLIASWKTAFRSPLNILTAFILIVYFGQYPIYLFTPLSTEAIMQTGYARGLIQLMPLITVLSTALLAKLVPHRLED